MIKYSIIIPVYKNQESLPRLLSVLSDINKQLNEELESVFVVDGSPDQSFELLQEAINTLPYPAQLIAHSRNFGSFAAIRTGLKVARGQFFAVMAADLQEPADLFIEFFKSLDLDICDIAIGTRSSRQDPILTKISSNLFWNFYKRFVVPEMPEGGVDVFACNNKFREKLLSLEESNSSLIALIFWLGYRRKIFFYERQKRLEGKSSWTLQKKIEYMMDSIFAFTNLPIKILLRFGIIGIIISFLLGLAVICGKIFGIIDVPGYAATITIILFFGTLNLLAIGLVGSYAWRAYENSKFRPLAILAMHLKNSKE